MMLKLWHFISMGGYAKYVWSAYGACALVLLGNALHTLRAARDMRAQLTKGLKSA